MNANRIGSTAILLYFLFLLFISLIMLSPERVEAQGWCVSPLEIGEPGEEEEDEKCKKCKEACKKSPCTVAKGNYGFSIVDLQIPTRGFQLSAKRSYNSSRAVDGLFGRGWTSNLLARLHYAVYFYQAPSTYLKQATVIMPDGETYKFTENPDGVTYTPSAGNHDVLIKNGDGTFDLTPEFTRSKYHFSAQGDLLSMTDDYNNALNFTYSSGRLQQMTDATGSGRYLNVFYGGDGRISSIVDHTGRIVEYEYNPSNGALITVTDPASRDTHYDYHTGRFAPLLSQIKDHWNRVITDITWDSADRVHSYTEAGETYTYTYNYQGVFGKTSKTDSSGNTWLYTFNSAGQVTQTDPPAGSGSASSVTSYNADGSIAHTIDEVGVQTSYTYNSNGTIATLTRDDGGPDAVRFEYSYDTNFPEKVIAMIPKDPSSGGLDLDWQGQKFDYYQAGSTAPGTLFHVYRVRNDGSTLDTLATYTYNSKGQVETITSATGGITTYGYNATTGDLISITYPKNSTSGSNLVYGYGRDSLGRLSSITNPLNKITNFTYDNLDRVLTITLPKPAPTSPNFVTTYTYDQYDGASGSLFTHRTDVNGKITKQGYDQFGQLKKSIDAPNNATTFAYNEGLLQSITDANGNVTGYSYNGLRQLTATNFAEGLSETYTYWEDGKLKSKTDRKNQTINYSYDHLKRLLQKSYPNSTSITFGYTGQKLMTITDTYANETHGFSYDSSYRVASNVQGTRGTVSYTYDPADRVSTYIVSGGGPTATYTYYDNGSLKTIQWSPVTGTFTYNYTLAGQYNSTVFPNNQQRNYAFDDQGRLTQVVNTHPTPGNLATYSYGYDTNNYGGVETMLGQRTSLTATVPSQSFNNHQTKYYYDSNYQLTQADYPNAVPFNSEIDKWTYDAIGNRTQSIVNGAPTNYTYYKNGGNPNNGQRLQSDGGNTYTYDNNGNMITKSGAGGNFTFTYDYENRLLGISGATTAAYQYDYMGRRSSKTVGGTTTFIYNAQDLIGERGANVADYLFGPSVDEPLSMRRSGSTYYFVNDGLGSINLINNASGTIQNKYVFDSWGIVRSQTIPVANPFGYTGREFGEASMLYSRARYYSPNMGRFTSEDPIRFDGGINWYSYVDNDPTDYIDPSGLKDRPWPVNGEVHNHSKDPVTAVDMDHSSVIDVPPNTNTTDSQDVDFVFIDGKWYKIGIWNFDVSETGKPDGGFEEATPKELEDIKSVLEKNHRDIEDPSKKTNEKKKC